MRMHPVVTGGNDPRGTNPEDRLLTAFSCLARLDRELAMLAVHAEASVDDGRAEALEETIRAVNTARLSLRAATRDWIDPNPNPVLPWWNTPRKPLTPRQVRDADKLAEAGSYLADLRDTDGGE